MTPSHLTDVIQIRFRGLCDTRTLPHELPGYKSWTAALEALGAPHGLGPAASGTTSSYAGVLVERGEDPEHILALFTLAFCTQ